MERGCIGTNKYRRYLEKYILMMTDKIIKIDDTTVAHIKDQRNIYGSTDLAKRRAALEEQLADVIALQDALK